MLNIRIQINLGVVGHDNCHQVRLLAKVNLTFSQLSKPLQVNKNSCKSGALIFHVHVHGTFVV